MSREKEDPAKKGQRRLDMLMQLNPRLSDQVHRGDKEAILRADIVTSLDGARGQLTGRKHPERAHREDGKPHHFCNGCSDKNGCISCDLDDLPQDQLYRWVDENGKEFLRDPGNVAGGTRKHRFRD